jgi:hypothetical protein
MILGLAACGAQEGEVSARTARPSHSPGQDEGAANELISQVLALTGGAPSVRVEAEMDSNGNVVERFLEVDGQGRCRDSMTFPSVGTVETVKVDDEVWIGPPGPYWSNAGGEYARARYSGMYVHGPVDHPDLATYAESCGTEAAFQILDPDKGDYPTKASLGPETTFRDRPALTVLMEQAAPDGSMSMSSTLLVVADGEPYPLRMTTEMAWHDPARTMTLRTEWHDFGAPFEIEAPAPNATVELHDLPPEDNPFPLR